VLAFALLVAAVLARVPNSPLRRREWLLLAVGLTQIPAALALVVVGWLFLLGWRGADGYQRLGPWRYNLTQIVLIGLTLVSVGAFVYITSVGLLGRPEMLVSGNGSSASRLLWFSPRAGASLDQPGYLAVSIWWYRLAMLAWASGSLPPWCAGSCWGGGTRAGAAILECAQEKSGRKRRRLELPQKRTKDQGPRTKDQGPRTKDQGPRTKDQGQKHPPRFRAPPALTARPASGKLAATWATPHPSDPSASAASSSRRSRPCSRR